MLRKMAILLVEFDVSDDCHSPLTEEELDDILAEPLREVNYTIAHVMDLK